MRSDPEPNDPVWRIDAENSMGGADASGPKATDAFEVERWMAWVGLQELVVCAGDRLHVRGKIGKESPESA